MGTIYIKIHIVAKYIDGNGNILWYTDINRNRYTASEIKHIVMHKHLPSHMGYLTRSWQSPVDINMKVTKTGRIYSKTGRIQVKHPLNKKPINIVCEDSNSGFSFYSRVISMRYPSLWFIIQSAYGYGNISNILKAYNKTDRVIVIMDNKLNDRNAVDIIEDVQSKILSGYRMHLFRPTSIEEVILSDKGLQCRSGSNINLHNAIVNYAMTGELYYAYMLQREYVIDGLVIDNLEDYLNSYLTSISSIKYTKSYISGCFVNNCCMLNIIDSVGSRNFRRKQYSMRNKLGSLASESLLGGLFNIIGMILGKPEKYLDQWDSNRKRNLYL